MTISIYFLTKGKNLQNVFFSTLAGFASFLSHPAYLSVPFAVFILLIIDSLEKREIKTYIGYFAAASIFGLIYLAFIVLVKHQTPVAFFADWFARTQSPSKGFFPDMLVKISDFASDYSLGIKRMYIMLYEILSPIVLLIYFRKNRLVRDMSIFTIVFIIFAFAALSKVSLRLFSSVTIPVVILSILAAAEQKLFAVIGKRIILVFLGLYFINSFLGIPYLINKDIKTTSYSKIENQIENAAGDNKSFATIINFWFPLKKHTIYNEYTRWEYSEFADIGEMFRVKPVDMIIISDYMLEGAATTSGRKVKQSKTDEFRIYYDKLLKEAENFYFLSDSFKTNGYGTIKFYRRI